ncbi:MAG TPA: hypothetical protein VEC09_01290 [Actinomycetota bacterium]|nr:hypothetical protein [Actinomycetota bacterium]
MGTRIHPYSAAAAAQSSTVTTHGRTRRTWVRGNDTAIAPCRGIGTTGAQPVTGVIDRATARNSRADHDRYATFAQSAATTPDDETMDEP